MTFMRSIINRPKVPSHVRDVSESACISFWAIVAVAAKVANEEFKMVGKLVELWTAEEIVSESDKSELWTSSSELVAIVTIQSLNSLCLISRCERSAFASSSYSRWRFWSSLRELYRARAYFSHSSADPLARLFNATIF